MQTILYKLENDTIEQIDRQIDSKDWKNEVDWIEMRVESRTELVEYLHKTNIYNDDILNCLEHPIQFPFSNTFDTSLVLNLSISNEAAIYEIDYISVILEKELIILITPLAGNFFTKIALSAYSQKKHPSLGSFLFYILAVKILAQSNINMNIARNRLHKIETQFARNPEELSSSELMTCEREISQLSDIIEDQYVGFEILGSISSSKLKQEDIQQTSKLIEGFQPLNKAMMRLEKKAESLRLQYVLLQQEKSTKKINVLTIVQAIFVPLTFIAGVYGMNFIKMPELEWPFGYLLVWLVFIGMASGLLIYFYRKGWFE